MATNANFTVGTKPFAGMLNRIRSVTSVSSAPLSLGNAFLTQTDTQANLTERQKWWLQPRGAAAAGLAAAGGVAAAVSLFMGDRGEEHFQRNDGGPWPIDGPFMNDNRSPLQNNWSDADDAFGLVGPG